MTYNIPKEKINPCNVKIKPRCRLFTIFMKLF